jgi:hypothetical protein
MYCLNRLMAEPTRRSASSVVGAPQVRLAAEWLITRLLVITLVAAFPQGRDAYLSSDIGVFWSAATSGQPLAEALPEYPGLGRAFALVGGLFDDQAAFGLAWLTAMLLVDALLTLMLAGHTDRSARIWVYGGAALGPLVWLRFDLLVALLVVAALLKRQRSPEWSGVLLGLAVLLKAWPVVLAAALFPGLRQLRWAGAATAAVAAGILIDVAAAGPRSVLSPWTNQSGRGVQIESTFATPTLVGAVGDAPNEVVQFVNRAYHLTEDFGGWPTLIALVVLATTAVVVFVACVRGKGVGQFEVQAIGAALLASMAVAVNPVFSPQYVMWFLPLLAVAASSQAVPRATAWLAVLAAGLTQLIYPWFYRDVVELELWGVGLLVARNLIILVMVGHLVWALMSRWPGSSERSISSDERGERRAPPSEAWIDAP